MKTHDTKRLTYRLTIVLAGLILFSTQALARMPRSSLTVEGNLLGKVRLDNPPVAELAEKSSKVGSAYFGVNLMCPVIVDHGKTMFFLEGKYCQRRFTYSHWPEGFSKEIDWLYEVSLGLTARLALNQQWAVIFNLTPQLATNFEGDELQVEDLKFQGAVIVEKTFNNRWTAGLGVAYSTTFGKPLPLPIATFRYESGGRWHASGYLPADADLWYRLSSSSEFGLVAHAEGSLYHIPEVFPAGSSIEDPEVQYLSVLFGPAVQTQINRVKFTVKGGLTYQSLSLFDGTDKIDNSKYDLKPGAFVNTGIEISF